MVRNVTFVETDIGLRFKSARGRGGVIEKIHVRDVAMKDIATGAVVFQTSYGGAAPAEEPEGGAPRAASPASSGSPSPARGIPQFQDFVIENLACDGAREAMTIEGLPEAPIRRIVFRKVTIGAQKGARLVETEGIRMQDVRILPAGGEALTQSHTRDLVVE